MKYIRIIFFLLSTCYATELSPWFPTPFELEGRCTALFEHAAHVQSPSRNFRASTNNASLHCSLDLTPWPEWNVEAELYLTHTHQVTFSYEAALFTLRHGWLDDITGDPISLATGVTVAFPGHKFLRNFSFPYHGSCQAEFHTTVGKEWTRYEDWLVRAWGVMGFGIANRGSPWLHGLAAIEVRTSHSSSAGMLIEKLCGLGTRNLESNKPFKGYGSIAHRNVDVSGFYSYRFPFYGTFSAFAWYNLYAHNYIQNYWGLGLSLLIPFSIL